MKSILERLEFAVRFAQEDIKSLRPGDVLNLKSDLKEFFAGTPVSNIVVMPTGSPEPISDGDLSALQKRWRMILFAVANMNRARRVQMTPRGPETIIGTGILGATDLELKIIVIPLMHVGQNMLLVQGKLIDAATYLLILCLGLAGPRTVLHCADPGCPKLFVRVRRQKFHSTQCAVRNAVGNMRRRSKDAASRKSVGKSEGELSGKRRNKPGKPNTKRHRT